MVLAALKRRPNVRFCRHQSRSPQWARATDLRQQGHATNDSGQRFPEARRLAPEDIEALDMLAELAGDPELRLDMNFMPGDIQFLHNHTILHARSAYEDWPEVERKRHLLRLWLSPPGARSLPPVFAECYGSLTIGDRGGIIC
jgi:hypothetical protein